MATTYVQIGSTVTVGVLGASSIDFTSIPATYTDLIIKLSGRTLETYNYASFQVRFNSSTTGFTGKDLYGVGASAGSATRTLTYYNLDGATATANTFASLDFYIPNYSSSTNKPFAMEAASEDSSTTTNNLSLVSGLWSNTSAITSISIVPTNNFVQYSTASLYGISKS
jgi:hypothetical protein